MTQSCSVEDGFVLNMGRVQDAKMLKEVMKVVEQEAEEMKKEEASTSIPKPSFLANLVAIQQLNNMPECPVPRKKKAKKTVRFILSTVSKRKLHMEEEEEAVGMSRLKRVKEERLLAEELEQIGLMMTKMLPSGKSKFV